MAGNVLSDDIVGSIEFACKVAGVKLIVIMGHTSCGAVIGACDDVALGKITGLVNKIRPAVQTIQKKRPDENSTHKEFVAAVAKQNVENVKEALTSESLVIRKMVGNGEIEIVGAMYDVENGQVYFDR